MLRQLIHHRRAWVLVVALTVVGAAAFVAAPTQDVRDTVSLVIRIGCLLAVALALPRLDPSRRAFGILLAASLVTTAAGDTVWVIVGGPSGTAPFPSAADGFYLAGYGLTAAAFWRLAPRIDRRRAAGVLVDALIVATAISVVAWEFLLEHGIWADSASWAAKLTSTAYPGMGLLTLAALVAMLAHRCASAGVLTLLIAGLVGEVVSDTAYAFGTRDGTYVPGTAWDVGWLAMYGCIAAALLHPSLRRVSPARRPARERPSLRLALLLAGASCVPVMTLVEGQLGIAVSYAELFVGSSVMLALVFVRTAIMARSLVRSERELAEQHAELEVANEDRRRLLREVVRTSERETSRISAELHDGPVQRLTALGYLLGRLQGAPPESSLGAHEALIEEVVQTLSREIDALRHIMQDLRPPALSERGLEAAIEVFARRSCAQYDWSCSLDLDLSERLEPSTETALYLVVQEALVNAARHGQARSVQVTLRSDEQRVSLVVEDDGHGFDDRHASHFVEQGHFGLAIMRERIEAAGGACQITSSPSRGTRVSSTIPVSAGPA